MPTEKETLLTFPCDFTIKVFGYNTPEFEAAVLGILREQLPNFDSSILTERASGQGKYKALSFTVHVDSKDKLDSIYSALTASPKIIMAL